MPAALLVHECKFQGVHEFCFCYDSLPSLSKLKEPVPIVTDNEVGVRQLTSTYLQNIHENVS